jgi:hypothetical protein
MKNKKLLVLLSTALIALTACNDGQTSSSTVSSSAGSSASSTKESSSSSSSTAPSSSSTTPASSSSSSEASSSSSSSSTVITYNVVLPTSLAGGVVTADKTVAEVGEEITITVTPDSEYELDTLTVNDVAKTVDSANQVKVTMVEGGITVKASFKQKKYSVVLATGEHYTLKADKTTAAKDEKVKITVNLDDGYNVEWIKVNGSEVTLASDNTYEATMTTEGINVTISVTDYILVSSFTDEVLASLANIDNLKVKLTADCTITSKLVLGNITTSYDLNGHKLSYTADNAGILVCAVQDKNQTIEILNGDIDVTGNVTASNLFDVTYASGFKLDGVDVTTIKYVGDSSAVLISNCTKTEILNSTIDFNGVYGITSNNLQGTNAELTVKNSSVTVHDGAYDIDNAAILINVVGANVTLEDSSFKADRQGIVARTGTWTVKNVTAETTGKYLTTDSNKTTNEKYLNNDSWGTGNEVPCAAVVIGDANTSNYNDDVTFTAKGLTTKVANDASTVVVRSDGTYKTTFKVDAASCVNSNNTRAWNVDDSKNTTKVTVDNFNATDIATLNKKTTNDDKNLYSISAVVKKVTNAKYGNLLVEDTTTGEEFTIYGSYTTGTFTCTDAGVFSLSNAANVLTSDAIGKVYNFIGVFAYYSNTAEIKNALAYKTQDSFNTCTASISVEDEATGTATLSKTNDISYGEEITITCTPASGYKVGSVVVTDGAGNKEDITSTLKFNATVKNTVSVTFVSESTVVASVETFEVSDFTAVTSQSKITQTVKDFTFEDSNGLINGDQIRVYKNATLTITAPSTSKITKVEFTCAASETTKYGLGGFAGDNYTAGTGGNTGTWELAAGASSLTLTAKTNQVRITKIVISYIPA